MQTVRGCRTSGNGPKRTQLALVARILAGRAGAVELDAADAAHVVLGHVPAPRRDRVPLLDGDLHPWSLRIGIYKECYR